MENRVLFIIGASSDVGMNYIKESHFKYDKIIAHYNSSKEQLEQLKEEIGDKMILYRANLSSEKETVNLIKKIVEQEECPTHVLHLPANKYSNYRFHKVEWEIFQQDINIQLRSIVLILKSLLPKMAKNKYGRVVIMLSSCTNNNAPKYMASYVSTKYALLGLTKALAAEYASKGICVNGISPGLMETKMLSEVSSLIAHQNAESNPQKRNVTVEDVYPVIDFLLSDEANFVTGQNIIVSGGGN